MKRALSFLVLLSMFLYGGTKEKKDRKRGKEVKEEVIVVAERTGMELLSLSTSVEMVNLKMLKKFHTFDLKEGLTLIPSVYIPQNSSHGIPSSVFFRGVSSTRGVFLLNTVPLTDPNSYSLPLDFIPSFFLSSVETVLGPQSALWGNGAMGFVSSFTLDRKRGSEVNILAGGMATIGFEGKTGMWRNSFYIKGGYSYFNTEGIVENNKYKRNSFYVTAGYDFGKLSVEPMVLYTNQLGYIPFVLRDVPAVGRRARDKVLMIQVPFKLDYSRFSISIVPYYYRKEYIFAHPDDPWGLTNSYSQVKSRGLTSSLSYKMGKYVKLVAGVDMRRENLTSRNNIWVQYTDFPADYSSVWGNFVYERGRFFLSAGGGYSHSSNYKGEFTPKAGASFWILKDKLKLRGSYGQGFRFPSPSETTGFWGNPDLLPEKSKGYEGGFDLLPVENVLVSFTLFQTDFEDLISYNYLTRKFANIGKARIEGWETGISGNWGNLFSFVGITRLKAEDLTNNSELLRRPSWMGKGFVSFSPFNKFSFSVLAIYVGERKDYDDRLWKIVDNPGYFLINLALDYRFSRRVSAYLKAHNILDMEYQDLFGYPSPGRTLYAGIRFEY